MEHIAENTHTNGKKQDLQLIAAGASISFLGNISIIILNVLFQFSLARLLGSANIGILSIGLSITLIATILATCGIDMGMIRLIARFGGNSNKTGLAGIINGGIWIVSISSITVGFIIYGLASTIAINIYNNPDLVSVIRVLAITIPLSALTTIFLAASQGLKQMQYVAGIGKMFIPAVKLIGLWSAVFFIGKKLEAGVWAIVFSVVLGVVASAWSIWKIYPSLSEDEQPQNIRKELVSYSWPLLLSQVINRTLLQAETLVLGALVSSSLVGIYFVGLKATAPLIAILTAFSAIFSPIMANLYANAEFNRLSDLFKTVTKWGVVLCFPAFIILFVGAPEVLALFGPEFVEGRQALRVLAVAQLFAVSAGPVGWLLTMTDYAKLNLINAAFSLILGLILSLVLIPKWGISGAAFGALITTIVINGARIIEVKSLFGFWPYNKKILKPIAASLISFFFSYLIKSLLISTLDNITFLIFLTLGVSLSYFFTIWILGIEEEDQIIISTLKTKIPFLSNI